MMRRFLLRLSLTLVIAAVAGCNDETTEYFKPGGGGKPQPYSGGAGGTGRYIPRAR